MRVKSTIFKWLDKLENIKISPVWGYSFAICLILYFLILNVAQWDVHGGGGGYIKLWDFLSYLTIFVALILIVLTKKAKCYGAKISRVFTVLSLFIVEYLERFIPSNPRMYGDCYFDPMDVLQYLIFIVAGFAGYAFGKYIAKKIKTNMASMKTESSQG